MRNLIKIQKNPTKTFLITIFYFSEAKSYKNGLEYNFTFQI